MGAWKIQKMAKYGYWYKQALITISILFLMVIWVPIVFFAQDETVSVIVHFLKLDWIIQEWFDRLKTFGLTVGPPIILYFTWKRTEVVLEGHVTDRYSKAIDQLGTDIPSVRIGALFALERISKDSPKRYHTAVMEVITSFISHSPYFVRQDEFLQKNQDDQECYVERIECPDIKVAIKILQERDLPRQTIEYAEKYTPSLSRASLHCLNLQNVNFSGLELQSANFAFSNLVYCNFESSHVEDANFHFANLENASFNKAFMKGTFMYEAKTKNCTFEGAIGFGEPV